MLEDFLSKLGASTKITVGVSISPSLGVEMIEIDRTTGTVTKYSHRPLEYNHSTREIADYAHLQIALEELFDELRIPKKSNIILSVPNVHFGMISLPLLLTDEAITNAVISEVEQSYIFKRQEPVVSWTEVYSNIETENRTLAYTALQKSVLDGITEICDEIGCTISAVENSYTSLLRALHYTGLAKEEMKENVTWNLMIIGQNSYSILSMLDKKIIEYYEEPLALKSFVDDEIYNAITTSAKLTLIGLPANYLFIVSETDLVSAEVLSMKISVDSTIHFLECNKYTQNEMLPINLNILPKKALQITPEAIGAITYPFDTFPLKLNLVADKEVSSGILSDDFAYPKINLGGLEIELDPAFIKKIALIVGGIIILPVLGASLLLGQVFIPKEQAKLNELNSKIDASNDSIKQYSQENKNNTFNLNTSIDTIIKNTENKLAYYSALGLSIPKNLWITYYVSNETGKIDIKGKSKDVESIYTFYKNLKQMVNNSDIRLYKLEIASESIDDVVQNISSGPKSYDFEITNMSDAELNPPPATADGTAAQPGAAAQDQNKNPLKPLFQFGKPIFGPKDNQAPGTNPPTQTPPGQNSTSTTPPPPPVRPTPPAAPTNPSQPQPGQLPKNLKTIEKF